MRTFADTVGTAWSISVNVLALKRVRTLLDVDLMEIATGSLLERLGRDPVLLCNVLFVICKEQADAAKITDEDFGRRMAGDAIEAATNAFLEEVVDFFPGARRALLRKALERSRTLEAQAEPILAARMEEVFQAAELRLKSAGSLSMPQPALVGSTPTP
jgi:hypothetical protein